MGRNDLINTTRAILAKAGFDVSSALSLRGICFDVVARLDDRVLIIKVLSNIDAFSKDNAEELKTLADALGATPIVIGERSSSGSLEAGIVYSRFNISIISNDTLADLLLEDAPPFIFAAPGGLYVKLDSDMLRAAREERGISLGTLAETAGVSRRTIQMYESGMGAMIDAALRIEEYLGLPIVEPIDPFEFKSKERSCEEIAPLLGCSAARVERELARGRSLFQGVLGQPLDGDNIQAYRTAMTRAPVPSLAWRTHTLEAMERTFPLPGLSILLR